MLQQNITQCDAQSRETIIKSVPSLAKAFIEQLKQMEPTAV